MLPDDVLIEIFLAIFDLCADENRGKRNEEQLTASMKVWQTLVHVCRRWRSVVFGSPRHLKLRLVCTARTPGSDTLIVWPALPLMIYSRGSPIESVDNIVAVLRVERSNRVDRIDLSGISNLHLETLSAAMQVPFPRLTVLRLWANKRDETVPVLPDSFLGGSAPHLQLLSLNGIPFPGLPKLLLSATRLVHLSLYGIPRSGYFSPEAMVTALSTLTSLGSLHLIFKSPRHFPDMASRRPPSPTRFVLPFLAIFRFKGVSEYFEDLVSHIDAPWLSTLRTIFFNQILFDSPQFVQFINRTPELKAPEEVHLNFSFVASVRLKSLTSNFKLEILCRGLDQVSSLRQVCTWCLPLLSVETLYIYGVPSWKPDRRDNVENSLWLELFQPFTAVKSLYLREGFAGHIGPALQELVERGMSEVLPTLQNIFLEGFQTSKPVQEGIQQFVATRQASYPIAVSCWDRDTSMFEEADD